MREVVWKSLKAGLPAPIYMEVYAFWQAAKRTEGGERRNGRLLGANGKLQKKIPFFKRSDYYQNLQPTQVICPDYKFLFILFFFVPPSLHTLCSIYLWGILGVFCTLCGICVGRVDLTQGGGSRVWEV